MKKRTWYNLIMVAIIVAIMAGGILGVGHIRGWFDKADGTPMLENMVGVVRMERSGVNYTVEKSTVLRVGDIITTQAGATVNITVGSTCVTLGGGAEVIVSALEEPQLHLSAGELFIDAWQKVQITFEAEDGTVNVTAADATVGISYRQGAQTVRVFRGSVADISAGQEKEYVGGEASVSKLQLESLNSFNLAQVRKVNERVTLCITNKELDELEEKRRQELQDMLNGATEPGNTEHVHEFAVTVVAPNCTEAGYTEYRCACGECRREDEVAAVGHRFGPWETVKEATTTQTGLQERRCSGCEAHEERVIQLLSATHTHSYTEEVVAPTCTEKGYTLHTCTCGNSYRDSEVSATGHHYQTQTIAPTCTAQGYTLHKCVCGASYMDDIKLASGHNWGEWIEKGDGLQERTCKSCGMTEQKAQGTILPHVHSYTVQVIKPTCTEKGYTQYTCACGNSYRDSETAAQGHSFGAWTVKTEATTEKEGLMERTCRTCGMAEQKRIDKLTPSHTHKYTDQVIKPTCTEKGYTLHTCACGHSYQDAEVAAAGHQYKEQVVAPTCTTQGYTIHRCACGDSYIDTVQTATGHSWSDWAVTKEATQTQDGTMERYCTDCQEKQTTTIPATGQNQYVYMTIRCDTILNNLSDLTPGKAEFVPSDGVILPTVQIAFSDGETVFDVLVRICEKMSIQLEYSWTPMYGTYYIEGINNLYEFDCGGQSGWMYKVNGWFPNYGVSAYELSAGDQIVFAYTCKGLGTDVGAPEYEG